MEKGHFVINWQTAPYRTRKSAQFADVNGHRLYAHRTRDGVRDFTAAIDGRSMQGGFSTIEACKNYLEGLAADLRYIDLPAA